MFMDDDDFNFSDDEFAKDNQLTIIDEARKSVLTNIENAVAEAKLNLKYNEKADYSANLNLITQNMSALVSLDDIDENLPEDEVQERIDKIIRMTTELTLTNIDDVLKSKDEDLGNTEINSDDTDTSDGSTDW